MITSAQNPKLKWVNALQTQAKVRKETGAFVIEGVRLAEEALAAGWDARLVLFSQELSERGQAALDGFHAAGAPVEEVSEQVMRSASQTETPQGILVVLAKPKPSLPEKVDFALIPDGVRDPGNLGTMLRTAVAAGIQAVLIPPGSVDAYAPKVVRAGMGAHFRSSPITLDWPAIGAWVTQNGLTVFLADARQGEAYYQQDYRAPVGLVMGGEAFGSGQEALRLAHKRVHIPMPGGGESLNTAAAAAILLFEVARQRAQTA
jgi:TrmH family RNA methyltransferase